MLSILKTNTELLLLQSAVVVAYTISGATMEYAFWNAGIAASLVFLGITLKSQQFDPIIYTVLLAQIGGYLVSALCGIHQDEALFHGAALLLLVLLAAKHLRQRYRKQPVWGMVIATLPLGIGPAIGWTLVYCARHASRTP